MNLLSCPTHPDRKQEMICLSDECPNRFELRCVQCVMASKCRQIHNWKMISQVIQEIFQLCESTEIKEEKKGKQKEALPQAVIDQQKKIQSIVQEFKKKIAEFGKKIHEKVDAKAKKILSKLGGDVDTYVIVKNILKTCKKDTEPQELINKMKEVSNYITCGSDNVVGFKEAAQQGQGEYEEDGDCEAFQAKLSQLLQNLLYIIDEQNQMPSQMDNLVKNYESQIDKLLDQVKQIPVLQNRIQSLNQKLQAKDAKLKKYETGGVAPQNRVEQNYEKKTSLKEQDDVQKVKRIQTLIDRRQKMRTSLIQHCQKSPQQELYVYQLKNTQNIAKLDFPVMTQTAYILNQCVLGIADELQFLRYSDSTTGEEYIEIPLISIKKQRNQPNQQSQQYKQKNKNPKGVGGFLDMFF